MLYPDELRALERMLMLTKKVMQAHRFFCLWHHRAESMSDFCLFLSSLLPENSSGEVKKSGQPLILVLEVHVMEVHGCPVSFSGLF